MFPTRFIGSAEAVEVGVALINPSAEFGSLTGWTLVQGSAAAYNGLARPAAAGPWIFWGGTSNISRITQRIDVAAQGANLASVDAGTLDIEVTWWGGTYYQGSGLGGSDEPRLTLTFLNAAFGTISSVNTGNRDCTGGAAGPGAMRWLEFVDTYDIPPLTRHFDIEFRFERNKGTNNDAAVDDVSIQFI